MKNVNLHLGTPRGMRAEPGKFAEKPAIQEEEVEARITVALLFITLVVSLGAIAAHTMGLI